MEGGPGAERGTPTWGWYGRASRCSAGWDAPPHPLGLHLCRLQGPGSREGRARPSRCGSGPATSVEPPSTALGLQRAPWSRPPPGPSAAFSVTPGESGSSLQ